MLKPGTTQDPDFVGDYPVDPHDKQRRSAEVIEANLPIKEAKEIKRVEQAREARVKRTDRPVEPIGPVVEEGEDDDDD